MCIVLLLTCWVGNIFQIDEQNSCGVDCVFMAVNHFLDSEVSYEKIENDLGPMPVGGYSLDQLSSSVRRFGLHGVVVHSNQTGIERIAESSVVILHLTRGHFVILKRFQDRTIDVIDSSKLSEIGIPIDDWSGNAIVVSRTELPRISPFATIARWAAIIIILLGGLAMFRRWFLHFSMRD